VLDLHERRLENFRQAIRDDPVEACLITGDQNVRYLTGFTGGASALLVGTTRTLMISDGRFTTQLAEECAGLDVHVRPLEQVLTDAIGAVLTRFGAARVGYEPSQLTVVQFETIKQAAANVALVGVAGRVEGLRSVKDEGEIEAIRRAIRQAERGFAMLRAGMNQGDSEKDLADALEGYLRHCGAVEAAFAPIVAVGRRAALPHAHPTAEARVGDDDFVLVDWGASAGAYKSDLTRVVITGKVTPKFETVYRTVLAAQARGIEALRPGVKAGDVDAAARAVIDEAGYGRFFNHGLGHGFGLEIHENPFFRRDNPATLKAGMVVTIEPGIYLPDWGGVRIEDDVLITPDGPEVLSRVPKTLDEIVLR